MDNPVVKILRGSGTTVAKFLERYGFSKDGFQQAVDGTYADLSTRLLEALTQHSTESGVDLPLMLKSEYQTLDLNEAYHLWQCSARVSWGHNLPEPPFRSVGGRRVRYPVSPVHFFFVDSAGSRDRFAKAMKLPRATLMRWERGYTKGMPVTVERALNDVHYGWAHELRDAQTEWIEATL